MGGLGIGDHKEGFEHPYGQGEPPLGPGDEGYVPPPEPTLKAPQPPTAGPVSIKPVTPGRGYEPPSEGWEEFIEGTKTPTDETLKQLLQGEDPKKESIETDKTERS